MIPQYFKGDDIEMRMDAAGKPAFDLTNLALDAFYSDQGNATPFLLMLYDSGRMPFSDRVPRDSFPAFFREALARFPFTGTFESYIFILEAIFGEGSGVLFDVTGPGKLEISVNAASSLDFGWQAFEQIDGEQVISDVTDYLGNFINFAGVSGIDSEYELRMLLAEIIPSGIFADVVLAFFALYNFVDDGNNAIVDHLGNQIVFIET